MSPRIISRGAGRRGHAAGSSGLRTAARRLVAEYLQRFPKDRYQTEVESWRELQSQNIEFTMKRLREPVESC